MTKRICSATEGCEKPSKSLGLCPRHYYLLSTYGTTAERSRYPSPEERFWSRVDKSGDCWNWTARKNSKGYGAITVNGKIRSAHRMSYELANGPIPGNLQVDHMCHNRACVRPDHLRLATNKQQMENLSGAQSNGSSGVRGVSWARRHQSWHVHVGHNGKKHFGGLYKSLADAETAAIALRLRLFTHNEIDKRSA